jgi:hypothetical protein
MGRLVDTKQTRTLADGSESSVQIEERPFGQAGEHDDPTFHNIATGLVAAGTDLGTALDLTARVNVIATAAGSTGVSLPAATGGEFIYVRNGGGNTVNVFPNGAGGTINGGAGGAAVTIAATKAALFFAVGADTWVTLAGA